MLVILYGCEFVCASDTSTAKFLTTEATIQHMNKWTAKSRNYQDSKTVHITGLNVYKKRQ